MEDLHARAAAGDSRAKAELEGLRRKYVYEQGDLTRSDPDLARVLHVVGSALLARATAAGGLRRLRERRDLEPVFVAALQADYGEHVLRETRLDVPGWPSVSRGGFDVVVRTDAKGGDVRWAFELKWCHDDLDLLHEAIWDAFKLALIRTRPDIEGAFLVTGASSALWAQGFCRDIFETGVHSSEELCARRFRTGGRRVAWDWLLEGGGDRWPDWVPTELSTTLVAAEPLVLGDEAWELRAVGVSPAADAELPFLDGWPRGARPRDARHPF